MSEAKTLAGVRIFVRFSREKVCTDFDKTVFYVLQMNKKAIGFFEWSHNIWKYKIRPFKDLL